MHERGRGATWDDRRRRRSRKLLRRPSQTPNKVIGPYFYVRFFSLETFWCAILTENDAGVWIYSSQLHAKDSWQCSNNSGIRPNGRKKVGGSNFQESLVAKSDILSLKKKEICQWIEPSMPRAMAIGKATHYTCRGSCGDCIRRPHKPDATVFRIYLRDPFCLLICTWKGHSGRTGQCVGSPQRLVCIAPLSALHACCSRLIIGLPTALLHLF